jgi:hypothetical protein
VANSETEIANAALLFLGHSTISSFDQGNVKASRLAKATYAMIRDETLRNHPWNFAKARVTIPATGTAPDFNFSNAYTIPGDSLRIVRVNYQDPNRGSWVLEGNEILTDLGSPIEAEYIKRVTDVALYDASFTLALAYNLARHWAEPLVKATTLKQATKEDLAEILQNARTSDGQESTVTLFTEGSWLTGRSGW